jgi:hypothetical protein
MKWARSLFRRNSDDEDVQGLEQLHADLGRDPAEFPATDLRPVLVPSDIFTEGEWVGPFHYFSDLPISLTWAFLRPHQTMMYLSDPTVASLEERGINWRAAARDAFWKDFQEWPCSEVFKGDSDEVAGMGLMHDDGLGPSRLFFARSILTLFPEGFDFFIPQRACAVVLRRAAPPSLRASLERFVEEMLAGADVPMSKEPFPHESLIAALESAGEGGNR